MSCVARDHRKLRKQLIFYDFSVEPEARQGRATVAMTLALACRRLHI